MMNEIRLKKIQKSYKGKHALKDVDLTVKKGEFLSLLGPSGCGKSTLLKIIAGLERMDGGELLCDGSDFSAVPVQKRKIGMVFQNYALFPNMTAFRNICFGLQMMGLEKTEAGPRAMYWLEKVRLDGEKDKYPHELSGGQQQRVALARALAPNPQILLLDEPLSALDAAVRTSLRNEIRQLQMELEITTVFVTHDQSEALAISDKIAVLNMGEVVEVDSPQNIYSRPTNLFTAEFIGATSKFDGVVTSVDPPRALLSGEYSMELPPLNGQVSAGDGIAVFFKAEDISISDSGDKNIISGNVVLHNFKGGVVQIKVETRCGSCLLIDIPSDRYVSRPKHSPIRVNIPPEACHVYNAKTGGYAVARRAANRSAVGSAG
ncbi:MAG: ABC transporter ATP-binding protein [Synergistaceae bacterium]|jgi:ABC-type Fe3+/spermidine/putrescine transport system ATPase subunit|nr:ABC transporter ATP-binding protein [Synergistaceae bacterium]